MSGTLYRMYGGAIAHTGVNLGNWDEGRTWLNFFDQGHCLGEGGGRDSREEDLLDALSKVWGFCANFRGDGTISSTSWEVDVHVIGISGWVSRNFQGRKTTHGDWGGVVAGSRHIDCGCSGEGL